MGRKRRRGENKSTGQSVSVSHLVREINRGLLKEIAAIVIVILIAAIPFCYGKYIEFNTNSPFDGGLNIYSAQCVANGQKVGVDVFPSARPATLLVNVVGLWVFGYSEFGPKLIQLLMQAGAFGLMYYTIRKLYGILPAAVSVILAAFYLSCPPFAKTGNVKEQYMIACMIIAACAFILNQIKGQWWWLLISGATAINIYYFKPTGLSVLIAIIVFIAAQTLLKRRKLKDTGRDVVLLAAGTIVGLTPLMLFYLWQGSLFSFMIEFPASMVRFFIYGFIAYGLILLMYRFAVKKGGEKVSRVIHRIPWKIVVSVLLVIVLIMVSIALFGKASPDNLKYKLRNTPVIGAPFEIVLRIIYPIKQVFKSVFAAQGGYLTGSRSVSDFSGQFANVIRYYRSFIVPIGLSLIAVSWWLCGILTSLFNKRSELKDGDDSNTSPSGGVDRFVLLLAIWWVLDMLFVWVSPRTYVEYFLPLNGSAAMLSAYAIYKCIQKPWGWCCVLAVWVLVDLIFARSIGVDAAEGLVIKFIIIGVSVGIFLVAKKLNVMPVATLLLLLICIGTCYQWNAANLKVFEGKVKSAKNVYPWEKLSHYIRDNSTGDDGLYVWGWLPGIYVQAQRFSPTKRYAAFSNMHTDGPDVLEGKIEAIVKDLKADPPQYIVDSQKIHFPFYKHPVFDLWPSWSNRSKTQVHMRIVPNQIFQYDKAFTPNEVSMYQGRVLETVEYFTKMTLTKSKSPIAEDMADDRARTERARHEAMLPLRDFVVNNYKIVPVRAGGHVLFKRKTSVER